MAKFEDIVEYVRQGGTLPTLCKDMENAALRVIIREEKEAAEKMSTKVSAPPKQMPVFRLTRGR